MASSRYDHLESLRGIAAFVVVFAHYLGAFYPYSVFGDTLGNVRHSSWESLLFSSPAGIVSAHRSAVALFFVLSGYVLSCKFLGDGYDRRLILGAVTKRPVRLVGLVYVTMIIAALLWANGLYLNGEVGSLTTSSAYFGQFWQGDFSCIQFIKNIIVTPFNSATLYNPPLWTIKLELYGSILLFAFLLAFGARKDRMYLCALVIASLVLWFQLAPLPGASSKLLYAGMFAGMLLADIKQNGFHHYLVFQNTRLLVTWAVVGLYLASYPNISTPDLLRGTIYSPLPQMRPGVYSMMGALMIFMAVDSQTGIQALLQADILIFLGRISYAVFAIHFLLLGSTSSWLYLSLRPIGHGLAFVITGVLSLLLILGSAFVLTICVDKPAIAISRFLERIVVDLSGRLHCCTSLRSFLPGRHRFK